MKQTIKRVLAALLAAGLLVLCACSAKTAPAQEQEPEQTAAVETAPAEKPQEAASVEETPEKAEGEAQTPEEQPEAENLRRRNLRSSRPSRRCARRWTSSRCRSSLMHRTRR